MLTRERERACHLHIGTARFMAMDQLHIFFILVIVTTCPPSYAQVSGPVMSTMPEAAFANAELDRSSAYHSVLIAHTTSFHGMMRATLMLIGGSRTLMLDVCKSCHSLPMIWCPRDHLRKRSCICPEERMKVFKKSTVNRPFRRHEKNEEQHDRWKHCSRQHGWVERPRTDEDPQHKSDMSRGHIKVML